MAGLSVVGSRATVVFSLFALLLSADARSQSAAPPVAISTYRSLPIDVDVRPGEIQPVTADDGRTILSYTLLITNWADEPLTLQRIDLLDERDRVIGRYEQSALEDPFRQRTTRFVEGPASAANRRIDSGRTSILQVDAVFAAGTPVARTITHRLIFEPSAQVRLLTDDGEPAAALIVSSEPLPIGARRVPVIGPPLRGGPWRCGNGLAFNNAHVAFYSSRTARMRVPQRFGCDFARIDADGQILPNPFPDVISNSMFYGYGEEVLAVGDGRIVFVRDGIPENVPQADGRTVMPVPLGNNTVSGNWVALDLGDGRYAFYAHLQPGSIPVRVGQHVRRGERIGRLGNSGNAVGPHLHFHISNAPSLNGGDGMPYMFDCFEFLGRGRELPASAPGRMMVRQRMPLQDTVMRFEERSGHCG